MRKSIFTIALIATIVACNNGANQKADVNNETTSEKTETPSSSSELYGKEWKLLELNGQTVKLDTVFPKYPHLIFEKKRISGNLGCNGFGGNVKFEAGNAIQISDIVSTEMACGNLEVEQGFLEVLNKAKGYTLENNVLTLNNEKKEITAKLEVNAK